ncbi:hypothetical protein K402DRAFT_3726 [Aulographum hederae CBS 113979]|uniref:Uncharacterized protein n=1 Tax=Aulographum hederae CBS 113979 TaxID=1176131 RepID=A0A6G1HGL9_9PEZI|nr:hypothetical protein K402DRAFT_3726 [Aulographum hederae CBS 113979]
MARFLFSACLKSVAASTNPRGDSRLSIVPDGSLDSLQKVRVSVTSFLALLDDSGLFVISDETLILSMVWLFRPKTVQLSVFHQSHLLEPLPYSRCDCALGGLGRGWDLVEWQNPLLEDLRKVALLPLLTTPAPGKFETTVSASSQLLPFHSTAGLTRGISWFPLPTLPAGIGIHVSPGEFSLGSDTWRLASMETSHFELRVGVGVGVGVVRWLIVSLALHRFQSLQPVRRQHSLIQDFVRCLQCGSWFRTAHFVGTSLSFQASSPFRCPCGVGFSFVSFVSKSQNFRLLLLSDECLCFPQRQALFIILLNRLYFNNARLFVSLKSLSLVRMPGFSSCLMPFGFSVSTVPGFGPT